MTRSSLATMGRRRATNTAALTMGLLATAGAFAPAALAEETALPTDPADPTTTAPAPSSTAGPTTVLTPEPVPTTTSTPSTSAAPAPTSSAPTADVPTASPTGAHYGTGKVRVSLSPSEDLPGDESLDATGAQVQLAFTDGAGAGSSTTCTFVGSSCFFPVTPGVPTQSIIGPPQVALPADSEFTFTLTKGPSSGQLVVDPAALPVLRGYTSSTDTTPARAPGSVAFSAPSGYRTLGVTVNGTGSLAGSEFSLCTIAGEDCVVEDVPIDGGSGNGDDDLQQLATARLGEADLESATTDASGNATFDGAYRPGTYTIIQTAAPAGQTVDPTPHTLVVGTATSLTERDTPVRLTLGTPASTPPAPTSSAPVATAPTATAPAGTSVASTSVAAGEQQTVSIGGFQPNEMVHGVLHSTPVDLGTVQADAEGVATFTFTVPAGFETGIHSVTMTGVTSGITGEATFTVTAAPTGGLAYTGTDVLPLLVVGGGLLAAGAGAVTVAARRRSA
jgi:hypothetical protein